MEEVRLIELRQLLALHDGHQPPGALDLCFGDGYLIATNPIYRNMRAAALDLGCRYTTEDYCHYNALKFASLGAILEAGAIPYCDNVTILRELERRRPGQFRFHHVFELAPNYVLHESAHLVADRLYRSAGGDVPAGPDADVAAMRGRVLGLNLMESFANTTELIARLAIETPLDDRILDMSSYMRGRPLIAPAYSELASRVGARGAHAIMMLGYLHANFLHDALPSERIPVLLELAAPDHARDAAVIELVPRVMRAWFNLSVRFRQLTQDFYLTYLGIDCTLERLLDFDFLATIESSEQLRGYVHRLLDVLDGPRAPA